MGPVATTVPFGWTPAISGRSTTGASTRWLGTTATAPVARFGKYLVNS
jgi:hypothetical protein